MKRKLLLLCIFISARVLAQSEGPNNPLSATYSAIGCLACPGGEWSNWTNVTAADGMYADVGLTAFPICFQTSCYYSRYLMASYFNFSVPSNASITGIKGEMLRRSSASPDIKDTIVQIYTSSGLGTNHADTSAWTSTPVSITYGDSTDLWGLPLTPAAVNDINFGFQVMIRNGSTSITTSPSSVDHIQVTVYYSLSTGTFSQTHSSNTLTLFPNPVSNELVVGSSEFGDIQKLEIYDVFAQLQTIVVRPRTLIDVSSLSPGIYFAVIDTGNQRIERKFVVQR